MTTELEPATSATGFLARRARQNRGRFPAALEAVAVAAAPPVLYVVLRLRGMAPAQLPDPSMHSTYIFDPHSIFVRYQAVFTPTSRLREAARVGFLVPARLFYLLFGAVPGFFAFRYVLALVAIIPVYLLMRRVYGRWAGFLAVAVIMSSPVLITTWGTDYPDSSAVSYLTGGLAALALTLVPGWRWRTAWSVAAGVLLTLAVWSHGAAVPLAAAFLVSYAGVRLIRARPGLPRDLLLLAAMSLLTTAVLAVASKLLIGQFNFISPTLRAAQYLGTPAQEQIWHSSTWTWAPYEPYLLVAPAVVLAYLIALGGRLRGDAARLFVGLAGTLAVLTFAYLQFFGSVQVLEMHYLSSTLWSALTLMFVMTLAEISLPLESGTTGSVVEHWLRAGLPALLVIGIAFLYAHARPHPPAMTWGDGAFVLGVMALAAALVGRAAVVGDQDRRADRTPVSGSAPGRLISATAIVVMTAAILILTVVPGKAHARFADTAKDPAPAYAGALGGNAARYIEEYRVASEIPGLVGRPAYRGEQLMTWWPKAQTLSLEGPIGIYHAAFNDVGWSFPRLDERGALRVSTRRPAQILLLARGTDRGFGQAVDSLAQFEPVVIRRRRLGDRTYPLYIWLVELRRYLRAT